MRGVPLRFCLHGLGKYWSMTRKADFDLSDLDCGVDLAWACGNEGVIGQLQEIVFREIGLRCNHSKDVLLPFSLIRSDSC